METRCNGVRPQAQFSGQDANHAPSKKRETGSDGKEERNGDGCQRTRRAPGSKEYSPMRENGYFMRGFSGMRAGVQKVPNLLPLNTGGHAVLNSIVAPIDARRCLWHTLDF